MDSLLIASLVSTTWQSIPEEAKATLEKVKTAYKAGDLIKARCFAGILCSYSDSKQSLKLYQVLHRLAHSRRSLRLVTQTIRRPQAA